MPAREKVEILVAVMGLAKQAEQKREVLALLPRFPTPEALDLANRAAANPEIAAEVKTAATRLERTVRRLPSGERRGNRAN